MNPGPLDVDRYLHRLGLDRSIRANLAGLAALQHAHLVTVPFENLDIVFAGGVAHDRGVAFAKIMAGRGGWCFELNGPFAQLLKALGFDVIMLGAAVLLGGRSVVLDHLTLEVSGGDNDRSPHLVDVGFGDGFTIPLELNRRGAQPGGPADFEFLPSPQGTTLARHVDGVPTAQYRFKRVAHDFEAFAPIAGALQINPDMDWHRKPFATRLLGPGANRVTLTSDTLKLVEGGETTERPVERQEWDRVLGNWFAMERPGPWPS